MAKGKKTDRMDTSWMDVMGTPSRKGFMKYLRGQQAQFDPALRTLRGQIRGMRDASKDPVVAAYERLAAGLPSEEAVSSAYKGGMENLAKYMQGVDFARGGKGVQAAVEAIGGAIGAEPGVTGDVAGSAGAVSGVSGGEDILSKAILGGAAAQMSASEAQRLSDIAGQRQQFVLGGAEARKGVQEQRRELARMFGELKGKRIGARVNPFEIASMIQSYKAATGGYGGGGAAGMGDDAAGGDGEVDPAFSRYMAQAIPRGLQGLMGGSSTPQGTTPTGGRNPSAAQGPAVGGYATPRWESADKSGMTLQEWKERTKPKRPSIHSGKK